jgi:uncharacterized membrane protein YidH (DUF202 family)
MLASVVDTDALLQTVLASLVAGVGITIAFSIAIWGAVRAAEARRDERPVAAGGGVLILVGALALCAAAVALGVVAMMSK